MANKRPPFETRNYPQVRSRSSVFMAASLVLAIVAGAAYVANHCWNGCPDWRYPHWELIK